MADMRIITDDDPAFVRLGRLVEGLDQDLADDIKIAAIHYAKACVFRACDALTADFAAPEREPVDAS